MNMDPAAWSACVAGAIRAEMAAQLRSPHALADHLGVARPVLRHRLAGRQPFDLVEVEVVAAWLGVRASELLARAERPDAARSGVSPPTHPGRPQGRGGA